jgi:hypothetical protein
MPEGNERTEYRYRPADLVMSALIVGACGIWLAFAAVAYARVGFSDLSYLKFWALWLQAAFWFVIAMMLTPLLVLVYLFVRSCFLIACHYRERFILDDHGITLIKGDTRKTFPWERVSICADHVFGMHIGAGVESWWVPNHLRRFHRMEAEIRRRILTLTRGPQPIPEGEKIPLLPPRYLWSEWLVLVGGVVMSGGFAAVELVQGLNRADDMAREQVLGGILLLVFAALCLSGLIWVLVVGRKTRPKVAIRLTRDALEYWNWRGREYVMPWGDIISLDLRQGALVGLAYAATGEARFLWLPAVSEWDKSKREIRDDLVDLIKQRAGLKVRGKGWRRAMRIPFSVERWTRG